MGIGFSGIFPVKELDPGYVDWFKSFPVADLWITVSSFLAGIFLLKNKELSVFFGKYEEHYLILNTHNIH